MATASVRWVTGEQFIGIDSSRHSVVLSTGEDNVGVRPSEMLLVALASCTAVDVVRILKKKRTPLSSLEIIASGEQDETPPWPYRKIHLKYVVSGAGLADKDVAQAIQLSEEKYCSVAATIRGVAEITTEYEILPE